MADWHCQLAILVQLNAHFDEEKFRSKVMFQEIEGSDVFVNMPA
jgi:hypothetical protein